MFRSVMNHLQEGLYVNILVHFGGNMFIIIAD